MLLEVLVLLLGPLEEPLIEICNRELANDVLLLPLHVYSFQKSNESTAVFDEGA